MSFFLIYRLSIAKSYDSCGMQRPTMKAIALADRSFEVWSAIAAIAFFKVLLFAVQFELYW